MEIIIHYRVLLRINQTLGVSAQLMLRSTERSRNGTCDFFLCLSYPAVLM